MRKENKTTNNTVIYLYFNACTTMTTFKKLLVSAFFLGFATLNVGFLGAARFDNAIQEATQPIQQHLEGAGFAGAQG